MSKKKKHDETPEPPSLFDNLDLFTTQKKEEPAETEAAGELPGIELPPVADRIEAVPMPPQEILRILRIRVTPEPNLLFIWIKSHELFALEVSVFSNMH